MSARDQHRPARAALALGVLLIAGCGAAGANDAKTNGAGRDDAGSATPSASARSPVSDSRAAGPPVDVEELAGKLEPCPPTDADVAARDNGLPDVTLACLGEGDDVRLAGLRGQPAVLNLWATWCGPCRDEAPYFQTLHERAGDELVVLGVDYEDPPAERALVFADELGLRYAQVADPDGTLRAPLGLGVGIPATFFVDADGRVVGRAHQPYQDVDTLLADVRDYLGVDV